MKKRYQVFVSSTYKDLIEERNEVMQAVLECECFPAGMELFKASDIKQWEIIKRVIDESDFYLLIIAGRYGSLDKGRFGRKISFTEKEFNYAVSKKIPILVFLHQNPDLLPAKYTERDKDTIQCLEEFRKKASADRMVAYWENKDQLHTAVIKSLPQVIKDNPEAVGWIRTDSVSDAIISLSSVLGSVSGKYNKNAKLHFQTASMYFDRKQYNEAIVEYETALKLDPQYVDALVECADAYYMIGDYKDAKYLLIQAVRIDPKNAKAHNNLGLLYKMEGNIADGQKEIMEASILDKKYLVNIAANVKFSIVEETDWVNDPTLQGDTFDNLGAKLQEQEEYSEAIPLHEKAVVLGTTYPAITYNNLGNAFCKLGKYEKALYYFDKALAIDPNYARAKNNKEITVQKMEMITKDHNHETI